MAFTKVVGAGIHTLSNITSHNVHSSGIITATKFDGPFDNLNVTGVVTFSGDANFGGNVSIAGTLTYDDVTNIDSVGLVTARDGIFVPDEKKAEFGNVAGNGDLQIYHSPSNNNNSFIKHQGSGALKIAANHFRFRNAADNKNILNGIESDAVTLYFNGLEKLKTTSTGAILPGVGVLQGASQTGIQSGGVQIGAGVTQLNFIGLGNTFAVNGTTVDVSISGNSGAGGTWSSYTAGIATTKSVGVNTNNLDDNDLVGVGNSFQGLYISNGMMITDNKLSGNHYIGTAFNGLMAGPVNIEGTLTIDGNYVVV